MKVQDQKFIDPNSPKLRQMAKDMGLPFYHMDRSTNQFYNDHGEAIPEPNEVPGLGVQSVVMEWPNKETLLLNLQNSN